jgi:hypothetical protein
MNQMVDLETRVKTLEKIILALLGALLRKNTEQDGNWGWPSFRSEIKRLEEELK